MSRGPTGARPRGRRNPTRPMSERERSSGELQRVPGPEDDWIPSRTGHPHATEKRGGDRGDPSGQHFEPPNPKSNARCWAITVRPAFS